MRAIAIIVTTAVLIACGQPSASGPSEAAAQPSAGATEDQAAFVARCTRELIAANPQSRQWAAGQCEQNWGLVTAAQPWVDALLAAAAAPGETVAGASLRTRVTQVRWGRAQGALVLQGTLGPTVEAQVDNQNMFNLIWGATGEMIPVDVVEGLRVRGIDVAMIGCWQLGTGEYNKIFRVSAPGKAPFELGTYERTAPTANAQSTYSASMGLSGRVRTLTQLNADGSEFVARCPL